MLLDLPTAKLHLRVIGADEDSTITLYAMAAEQAAISFLDRAVYVDGTALAAAIAAAPAALSAATVAYNAAITAAALVVDPVEQSEAVRVAQSNYMRAQIVSRQTNDGMVVNEAIKAAMLLTLGTLYAQREDAVIGVSVASLPNGAQWLLFPYRMSLGV